MEEKIAQIWFKLLTIFLILHNVKRSVASTDLETVESMENSYYKYFRMPWVTPTHKDQYVCSGMALNTSQAEWVLKFEPLSSANRVHHMLLYGCSGISRDHLQAGSWDCLHHGVCTGNKILYAWAKNAPSTHLPDDVGFLIGGDSGIKFLTLQIHYKDPLADGEKDNSGLRMVVTHEQQKYKGGIYLLLSGYVDIPPLTEKTHADVNCRLKMNSNINIFAFRSHAHSLGTVITGYKYDAKKKELMEITRGNPKWPQAFYPTGDVISVANNDILLARCTYNSSGRNRHTYIGATSDDEMCNLYLMYYTDVNKGPDSSFCAYESYPELTRRLPANSDEPLPPNPLLEEMTKGENKNKDKEVNYNQLVKGNSKENGVHIPNLSDFVASNGERKSKKHSIYYKEIHMPGVTPKVHDSYMCTGVKLNETEEWVLKYEPLASANRAHHMLLFGCSTIDADMLKKEAWDCGHHGVCAGGRIMYAWAKNAPATQMPSKVGFRMGGTSAVKYLALQIHYSNPLPDSVKDKSGLKMHITTQPQAYMAGIFLLASGLAVIPPHTPKINIDINCQAGDSEPVDINLFAYRVHAHSLSTVISGYKVDAETRELTEIVRGNPQWPQAFYPMEEVQKIHPNDILHARCTYNSTGRSTPTHIGSQGGDEMCNLYLMYYTDREKGSEMGGCFTESFVSLKASLPPNSDKPLPPNPDLEELTHGENKNKDKEVTYNNLFQKEPIEVEKKTHLKKPNPQIEEPYPLNPKPVYELDNSQTTTSFQNDGNENSHSDKNSKDHIVSISREGKQLRPRFNLEENWGPKDYKLGQVTGVAVDSRGDVVIFHRGNVVWNGASFQNDVLIDKTLIIAQPTLLHLQRESGQVMHEWGAHFFHMPHGLSIDKDDNIWVTDVGMHQVFKFPSGYGEGLPILTLGKKFEPGDDDVHFCKPTGVAVLKNGEFFISDGYCNSRIIHFSPDGAIIKQFGGASQTMPGFGFSQAKTGTFNVPHAVTLAEDRNEICVSDRENGRIQCFDFSRGQFSKQFQFDSWGRRVFAAVYSSSSGGRLFAVNGAHLFGVLTKVQVFEVDYENKKIVSSFSPYNQGLSNPHDIAISSDGTELYVVEIGPNKIWKFAQDGTKNTSKQVSQKIASPKIVIQPEQLAEKVDASNSLSLFSGGWSSVGVSSVILGLLAIPLVVLSTLTIFIWCRKRGRGKFYSSGKSKFNSSSYKNGGLNLGSLLNKHHGFEKVSTNDLDDDDLESAESDIEEFSLAAAKV